MPDTSLELQTRVRRIDDMLDAEMDNETVMMDIEQGRYFGLNQTGTRIWALLAQPVVIRDLCDQLADEFNVPPEQCEKELFDFLGSLSGRGLLQVVTDETS